jgi:hypothetical protein
LNGKNYSLWSHKILTISEFRDFDQIILGKEQRPKMILKTMIKDIKRLYYFSNCSVADTLVPEVRNATIASVLWTNLKNKYQASEVGWALYLKNLLFSTKLQEGGFISEYLLQLKDLSDQLSAIQEANG